MRPGYSRIDESRGSIYWQIDLGDKEVDIVSRQRISDQLLSQLSTDCGRPFVPRAAGQTPEHHAFRLRGSAMYCLARRWQKLRCPDSLERGQTRER
jgi:hypothetical protein